MSKYIDLATRISDDLEPTMVGDAYIRNALRWLDEHPEHVPGRTITESELRERSHYMTDNERVTFMEGLSAAGGRVVPDPEPTNAEKLAGVYMAWADTDEYPRSLIRYMDDHGVKVGGA